MDKLNKELNKLDLNSSPIYENLSNHRKIEQQPIYENVAEKLATSHQSAAAADHKKFPFTVTHHRNVVGIF